MLPSQVGNCTVMDALFSIGIVHKNPHNFSFHFHFSGTSEKTVNPVPSRHAELSNP